MTRLNRLADPVAVHPLLVETMKALVLVLWDGQRFLATVVPDGFDTQAWAESRRAAFALLGVVKVLEYTR